SRELLKHMELIDQTNRVLLGTKVRLVCDDVPFNEALDKLVNKTGLFVRIDERDRVQLKNRMVTLDTGETTAWDALRQLCQQAAAGERAPALPPPAPALPNYYGRGRGPVWLDSRYMPAQKADEPVVLTDGRAPLRPTFVRGALRIQALVP